MYNTNKEVKKYHNIHNARNITKRDHYLILKKIV